jgi:epsilon-lactone hydrolase
LKLATLVVPCLSTVDRGHPSRPRRERHGPARVAWTRQAVNLEPGYRLSGQVSPSRVTVNTNIFRFVTLQQGVTINPETIGGVRTAVVVPRDGISPRNIDRVLINLHGGGMVWGARYEGQIMSIPIASVGKIKVITVDYRMAPEYRFPAASEDVAAVFSGEWFRDERLLKAVTLYKAQVRPGDPLESPVSESAILAKFPPSAFLSASRDITMSSAIYSHMQLIKAGAVAELYLWDGLGHDFMSDMRLPESREAYDVIVKFFNSRLGK